MNTTTRKEIAHRVRTARAAAGYVLQRDALPALEAQGLRWNQNILSTVETGQRGIKAEELLSMARAYGTTVDILLGEESSTTAATEQQPAGQTREERRSLMQDLYGYEGTVTASLMEITDRIADLALDAAAGRPGTEDTTAAAVSLLTRTNKLTDLLSRTVGDYPATIPGELRAPIYELGDRIRHAAYAISSAPTPEPILGAAHATTSRLLRAWADTVQRITF